MGVRDRYINNVLRERWNDDANPRVVTFYDETGAQASRRNYTAQENAEADTVIRAANRALNRTILLDRAQAAVAANLAALSTAQAIEGRTSSFSNTQRDDALRFLAGEAVDRIKQTNAIIKLLLRDERPDLLDTAE